jgi:hypothetical protein
LKHLVEMFQLIARCPEGIVLLFNNPESFLF